MGQRSEENSEDLDAFVLDWVRVGPVPAAAHESLLARFLRCRAGRDAAIHSGSGD